MRLDVFLCTQGLFPSRTKASEAVARGLVLVNGKKAKAGAEVNIGSDIRVIEGRRFVSNGGYKLDKALEDFGFDVKGLVFADIGASTGGIYRLSVAKRGCESICRGCGRRSAGRIVERPARRRDGQNERPFA